jgi:5,10-methylenetetrahydrofolate reductase
MTFREKLAKGQFVFTAEIGPPKGVDLKKTLAEMRAMGGDLDAINVTDLQGGIMKLGSLALSHLLIDEGREPIFQLTASARNKLAIQSELLSAHVLGIRNVLLLGGDPPSVGDHKDAKPVYDLDTMGLFQAAQTLKRGTDLAGNKLEGEPDLFIGGAVNPGAKDLEVERQKTQKKIELGCQFFQSQAVFDPRVFDAFLAKVHPVRGAASNGVNHVHTPIIAGIILLKSAKMARYMNEHIPGISVPEDLIREVDGAADKEKKAVEIAVRLVRALQPRAQGIHLMPIGWGHLVPEIIAQVKNQSHVHHRRAD